eukprot:3754825-Pleurochrysis_carterae.AAC.1
MRTRHSPARGPAQLHIGGRDAGSRCPARRANAMPRCQTHAYPRATRRGNGSSRGSHHPAHPSRAGVAVGINRHAGGPLVG